MSAFAEAGLSECARENMDCMPGFGTFLVLSLLTLFTIGMAFAISMSATLSIVLARPGVLRGALWFVAVWTVPLLGAVAWFLSERRRTSRPDNDKNIRSNIG
ncbi:hypothetical protein FND50_07430 [Rhodococcus sp. WB9]|uniref:hypothetical protein n=1 Tax=Rhodococcus sp. WB9 TaxID=2594007 RepID=UPI001186875A|nr:hypothetical protein [Rhodococcus sp. WB9]QDQ90640.1 hypothetical protein FND50_07430 [Rhodococcus sp. WB9]